MKLFLDTADLGQIKKWAFLIDGVTTNPTHLAQEGTDPKQRILEICAVLTDKDVSVEVTQEEPEAVYRQACEIAALSPDIVVKIPCHEKYYRIIDQLVNEGIRLNITLVFSLTQALMMCKFGVEYVSPFIGRLDDNGQDGIALIYHIQEMIDTYDFDTELLAASIRSVEHLNQVIEAEADVATVPVAVLQDSLKHDLTDQGMQRFLADWHKLGVRSFP